MRVLGAEGVPARVGVALVTRAAAGVIMGWLDQRAHMMVTCAHSCAGVCLVYMRCVCPASLCAHGGQALGRMPSLTVWASKRCPHAHPAAWRCLARHPGMVVAPRGRVRAQGTTSRWRYRASQPSPPYAPCLPSHCGHGRSSAAWTTVGPRSSPGQGRMPRS